MRSEQILRGAADIIRRDGWSQDTSEQDGRCCVLRAIGKFQEEHHVAESDIQIAHRKLGSFLGLDGPLLWRWNDEPERTVDDVLTALEGCAAQLEQRA